MYRFPDILFFMVLAIWTKKGWFPELKGLVKYSSGPGLKKLSSVPDLMLQID